MVTKQTKREPGENDKFDFEVQFVSTIIHNFFWPFPTNKIETQQLESIDDGAIK